MSNPFTQFLSTHVQTGALRLRSAFSLVELLVVIGILAMTITLLTPVISGLAGGRQVTSAVSDFALLLEHARTQATARQTYTWVLFGEEKGQGGKDRLSAVVLASMDGTPDSSSGNLRQISRRLVFENVVLADADALHIRTQTMLPGTARGVQIASASPGFTHQSGGTTFDHGFAFSPRGEAMVDASTGHAAGFDRMLDIGIRQTRAGQPPTPNADDAAIVLFGASGRAVVIRS